VTVPFDRLAAALADRYRLERELGQGGMATVYLAHDLRHDRRVAIKVVHPELTALLGADRFLAEIKTTAALQHPHILPLFDSGQADGQLFYVMPFVEGESLRERLTRETQLPVEDAVRLAREVADALAHAHGHGVIHRDIKPENILLQGGHALVADFGIALAVQSAGGARLTQTGLSLGTPQYMAPEQAMGDKTLDARADVYALGCVTYEMLVGEPPFTGPSAQAILAAVVTKEPAPPSERRKTVPAHVESAVLTALERLPADRYASAAEFAAALGDATTRRRAVAGVRSQAPSVIPSFRLSALLALATLGVGGLLGWFLHRPAAPAPGRPVAFNILSDSTHQVLAAGAISPDGMTLVYPVAGPTGQQLYVRRLDQVEPHVLPGTAGALDAFFSPDGTWVGFMTPTALAKVRVDGSAVVTLDTLEGGGVGGTWLTDNTIVFAPRAGGLRRVPADGGPGEPVPFKDSTLVPIFPRMLPGGRRILFTGAPLGTNGGLIGVLELATGTDRILGEGGGATYVRPNRIVFGRNDGRLYVQPFDAARGDTIGPAARIEGAQAGIAAFRGPDIAVGLDGTIATLSESNQRRLILADRQGRVTALVEGAGLWAPRYSPDAHRIAYGNYTPPAVDSDLWLYELQGGTSQRLTYEGKDSNDPQWSPDGRTIAFSTTLQGVPKDIYLHSVRGDRPDRLLLSMPGFQWPSDWSRDGKMLVFTNTASSDTGWDIWMLPVDSGARASPFLATLFLESGARLSPDGHWIAYTSNETGQSEVYVQSFPVAGNKVIISSGGGRDPAWRGDGRELFFWQGDRLIAAQLDPIVPLAVRGRAPLFHAAYIVGAHANYDVRADGQQFVVVTDAGQAPSFVVLLNRTGPRVP
jgi:serine/threonine-protein kinase